MNVFGCLSVNHVWLQVNELYQNDKRSVSAAQYSNLPYDLAVKLPETVTKTDCLSEMSEKIPQSSEILGFSVNNQDEEKQKNADNAETEAITVTINQIEESRGPYEVDEIEEIVQVPLYDNEINGVESEAAETDEKAGVPLSDAPLIGAPFRLISFFARYVSGADLVEKNTLSSGR